MISDYLLHKMLFITHSYIFTHPIWTPTMSLKTPPHIFYAVSKRYIMCFFLAIFENKLP